MNVLANTRVSVLRGTTLDPRGEPQDSNTPVATGIPASLIERRQVVATPDSQTPRVVRWAVLRVKAYTDIREGDRIKDERTNKVWIADEVTQLTNPVLTPELRIQLRRVN